MAYCSRLLIRSGQDTVDSAIEFTGVRQSPLPFTGSPITVQESAAPYLPGRTVLSFIMRGAPAVPGAGVPSQAAAGMAGTPCCRSRPRGGRAPAPELRPGELSAFRPGPARGVAGQLAVVPLCGGDPVGLAVPLRRVPAAIGFRRSPSGIVRGSRRACGLRPGLSHTGARIAARRPGIAARCGLCGPREPERCDPRVPVAPPQACPQAGPDAVPCAVVGSGLSSLRIEGGRA